MRADPETLDLIPASPAPAKPKTPLPTISVAAGTPSRKCQCGAMIYMVEMPSGRWAPIHCDVIGGRSPAGDKPGIGIVHFLDCPFRDRFRRRR